MHCRTVSPTRRGAAVPTEPVHYEHRLPPRPTFALATVAPAAHSRAAYLPPSHHDAHDAPSAGRFSGCPRYDAAGSPHGLYGPPALLVSHVMRAQGQSGDVSFPARVDRCTPAQTAWTSDYYMRRERQLREMERMRVQYSAAAPQHVAAAAAPAPAPMPPPPPLPPSPRELFKPGPTSPEGSPAILLDPPPERRRRRLDTQPAPSPVAPPPAQVLSGTVKHPPARPASTSRRSQDPRPQASVKRPAESMPAASRSRGRAGDRPPPARHLTAPSSLSVGGPKSPGSGPGTPMRDALRKQPPQSGMSWGSRRFDQPPPLGAAQSTKGALPGPPTVRSP
eukprot:TRINITY_DN1354_c0_g1_i1.p1 TRINITY_DN1354_c0_g1~~TRINITY_DN1354_c0_g1_i1.p1  ORF type:complete len:336 (+),score=68.27 TRINITY_DN1354_c0_g1_i1:47-1054(+)